MGGAASGAQVSDACGTCSTELETLHVLELIRANVHAGKQRCPDCLGTKTLVVHEPKCRFVCSLLIPRFVSVADVRSCDCRSLPS